MIDKLTKITAIFCFCVFFCPDLYGQHQEMKEDLKIVKNVLSLLFDGMREGDSAKVASVFDPKVQMYTSYTDKSGDQIIKQGDLQSFLKAIGTPHSEIWDERLQNTDIKIDGGIAQIWTDYTFHIGDKFSHCGVDAFHLIKTSSTGWKIIHLMDTRTTDCRHGTQEHK